MILAEAPATALAAPTDIPFHYRRLPTLEMPVPTIPENLEIPSPAIHDLFELRLATTPAIEADAYTVRWQVYCRELGYEPAERFPDQREFDAADRTSVQMVAYHRPTGTPVGCFRLLLADPDRLADHFHLEEVCPPIDPWYIPRDGAKRLGYAEISRYCILQPFRRFARQTLAGYDPARWAAEAPLRNGLAALMWLAAAHIAVTVRLDYILALMEPRLCQVARSWGFVFQQIGDPIAFRGTRAPYRIDRRSVRALLKTPPTDHLIQRAADAWEDQAERHPLLVRYLQRRTERVTR